MEADRKPINSWAGTATEQTPSPAGKEYRMANSIHPTAIVDPRAVLEGNVTIGPYSIVSGGTFIGSGTELHNHVTIMGNVRIGRDNQFYPNCVIGGDPQDRGYRGEPTWVVIGDRNVFREAVTVHRGTTKEMGITRVGDDNYIMANGHLAHDVMFGSRIYMANATLLSGHVHVHDDANISGSVGIHHFCTVGSFCFIGGLTKIVTDVPPYMLVDGNPAEVRNVNLVGLRRRGMSNSELQSLNEAYRLLYRARMGTEQARKVLEGHGQMTEATTNLFNFLETQHAGRRGRGREKPRVAA